MREATTANKQQLANLTRKICEVDRSMKMKTENGAFIAENFVQKTKKTSSSLPTVYTKRNDSQYYI